MNLDDDGLSIDLDNLDLDQLDIPIDDDDKKTVDVVKKKRSRTANQIKTGLKIYKKLVKLEKRK